MSLVFRKILSHLLLAGMSYLLSLCASSSHLNRAGEDATTPVAEQGDIFCYTKSLFIYIDTTIEDLVYTPGICLLSGSERSVCCV